MKQLEFKTEINAAAKRVWETMLNADTYKEWVEPSWPGSYYTGKWGKGEIVRFLSSEGGGTAAKIAEYTPYQTVFAEHVAVIHSDGKEDRDSDVAKGWVGSSERYSFAEDNGKTTVRVSIKTAPEWESMFNDGWPAALNKLKEISERATVDAR
jgi:uncharacterized protein YndB with AHSA1/START domain